MSNEIKHTPGKWKVSGDSIVTANEENCIAVIETDGGYEVPAAQREGNGCLIAAAPDLLEACNAALRWMQCGTEAGRSNNIEFLKKALARAETL